MTWRLGVRGIPPEGILCIGVRRQSGIMRGPGYIGTIDDLLKIIPCHELAWKITGIGRMQLEGEI